MKTYDYMVGQLGEQCLFANQMLWEIRRCLRCRSWKEIAAKDAVAWRKSSLFPHHEGKQLPPEVKSWVDLWLSYGTQATALVGLFGAESVDDPVRRYLAEVAQRAKIEFFCQPGIWPGAAQKTRHDVAQQLGTQRKDFFFLANVVEEEPTGSHWGIKRIIYGTRTQP